MAALDSPGRQAYSGPPDRSPCKELRMSNTPLSATPTHALPSYLDPNHLGPWGVYLQQVDRVPPYLGNLARWVETLKRPKRALIVDIPIELDNGTIAHFEGYRVQHNVSRGPGKGGVRAAEPQAPVVDTTASTADAPAAVAPATEVQ